MTLVEGEGFAEGEWTGLEKQVLVTNTKRKALIDLKTGNVTATGTVAITGTISLSERRGIPGHCRAAGNKYRDGVV